eukprot:7379553-Prymnesium_polylepis.2
MAHLQIEELTRLVLLVQADKDDPKTGEEACFPVGDDEKPGLCNVWADMKKTGARKAELEAKLPVGFDLDAFTEA